MANRFLFPEVNRHWSLVIPSASVLHWLAGFGGFALGAIACLVLAVVEFGAWTLVVPPRLIADENEQTNGLASDEPAPFVEPIAVRARDGARLAGRWFPVPGQVEVGRTVLLLHGFAERSSALESRRVATFHRHRWNVASLDSRGYGQSEGPFASFGGREADDIRAWLDMLAEHLAGSTRPCDSGPRSGAARWARPSPYGRRPWTRGSWPWCSNRPWLTLMPRWPYCCEGTGFPFPSYSPDSSCARRQACGCVARAAPDRSTQPHASPARP